MYQENFDFYNSTSLKSYNLNQDMRYELLMLDKLDPLTKKHSENVGNLCCRICEYLRLNKNFTIYSTVCGYLHDIGKLFIPKEILDKPTTLTDEEFEIMKTHTTLGYKMCMNDLQLRPFSAGPLYHHEALDGTGYPSGLKRNEIPFVAQVVRVADEYDAIVTKRHYRTHVHITEVLKELIKDANPSNYIESIALEQLSENSRSGKISPHVLKALFKVVIDDILYEISFISNYIDYLKDNIKRLEQVKKYNDKMNSANNDKKKNYYSEGMKILLHVGESFENYPTILNEYKSALEVREQRIKDLYAEIKVIKKLKI